MGQVHCVLIVGATSGSPTFRRLAPSALLDPGFGIAFLADRTRGPHFSLLLGALTILPFYGIAKRL